MFRFTIRDVLWLTVVVTSDGGDGLRSGQGCTLTPAPAGARNAKILLELGASSL
jgi:hypothetical protein